MNDWYKKGELPPVGSVVEFLWGGVSQGEIEVISYRNNGNTVVFWRLDKDHVDAAEIPAAEFRPIRTETDKLVEQMVCDMSDADRGTGENAHRVARSLVEQGYRKVKPMMEDEFIKAANKYAYKGLYQAGCRFIEQGE